MTSWEIEWHVKKRPKLKKPILIEGLPGIANVGKIAIDFLAQELKAKHLASFYSHSFPHSVFINEANLVEVPKIELWYKKNKDPKLRDILILAGDVQPIDERSCYSFCDEVVKIAKEFGVTEIITTGGIGLQTLPENPKVYATANNKDFLKSFQKKSYKVETKIFGVVGPIIGVSGVLVGTAQRNNINAAALLAETFAHQMYLGVKGATEILKVLNKKYKLKLALNKLSKEISDLEKEVLVKTKEWLKELSTTQQAGGKLRGKDASYIG
ncbi:hypothetical protein CL619_03080 [archaeon]|nr:hypothetical protein [archaeon]